MWKVEYTKRFLKELASLPQDIQSSIRLIVFQELEADNPYELGYLKKMKGYKDKYKIRIGDYRVGLTLDKKNQKIICQRVAHRREIYKTFP
ncbi:MAG: type II toxin-antitoxin system RelE family toxin [Microcystis panniformis]|jgi:mRNA interferase RelE/StbE|uniref:Type II toxin-antitoxin system RelE/ParE family toxin n=2 Tax=Microcystis aeruginosa TaxID=1126 RepID=A0A552EC66_MICAE|nr:type II toxin-antitoxin system RelE/ParE family toxin [Microcystis aeruginosa]MBE5229758.1 type II toxin-antitoxin system RelE/ParE family toxin [Microcystis aeruginosa PMC 728.11]NCR53739.1 type II toxin-antitoxin system RelE/ParE family toxin [Microcystis aeruginosa L211-07]NCS25222.1 type II toxin-antitoxin system RelE/ParE family toxin [Microcystis aeruginosa BS13-02]NCS27940.1 type II toxin-antitoxin system RelE/ParE family toxin [Microcystis aeruginosa F13-15]TRU21017.1 MAG: type II t